jgi:hypothetical protein
MPAVSVEIAGESMPVRFQFWGDELTCRRIRGIVHIPMTGVMDWKVVSTDERLVLSGVEFFPPPASAVEPIKTSLREELVDASPRLLVVESELPGLRLRMETTHRHIWSRIEDLFAAWDLPQKKSPESKAVEGPERLFGEDRAVIAAFRGLLEPTADNVDFARKAFFDYVRETEREDFEPTRIDTQCGEVLFTLCICYEWLYKYLDSSERERARRRLWEVADVCWGHLGYERRDYAQAHFLGCGLGLLAFSFLFWESHPRAEEWASYLRGTLQRVMAMLPADGFYPHGINLWIYEYGFLLRWLELFRVCIGEDLWRASEHWKSASLFRACATSPDFLYGVTMGDPQYRVGGDSWCHYLIAARTGSAEAQWLAEQLADGPHAGVDYRHIPPRRRVFEFLFCDPVQRGHDAATASRPVGNQIESTVRIFEDGGQLYVRTRTDDGSESLFTFRSGPPIGQQRRRGGEPGAYGHSDPANGSFLLFHQNEFLVSGPGPTYRRDTALHNTITFDGQGQIGDSTVWLPDFFPPDVIPPCTEVRTDGRTALLFADLAPSYLPHLGVETCTRSMLVDLGSAIVGVDTVVCSSLRAIEWNLHTRQEIEALPLHILLPEHCSWKTELTKFVPAYPNDGTRDTALRLAVHGRSVQWVWVIGMMQGCRPELARNEEGLVISGLPGGKINFDGKWLLPEGFDETRS